MQVCSCNHFCSPYIEYYTTCVCVCSLSYPACNAHALYCYLWPARLYSIFPRHLIKGIVFEKRVIMHKMCLFIFSLTFSVTFLILRRTKRDIMKNVYWSSCKVHDILVRLYWNLNFLDRFSKSIKFHENPLRGSWFFFYTDGRKDGQA
jgi:hypothetical protein